MDLPHQGEQADSSEFCDAAFANSFSAGVGVSGDAIEGAPAKESAGVIPKGFRARWRAKSQSKAEAASDERQVSDYQSQSPSLASWDEVEPVIKKPRTQSASSSVAHLIQEQTVGEVQRIADVARLEALQRFRTHDIKMPWEKGPLAPIFGAPMPTLIPSKNLVMPMVGLVDTLAPSALSKQDTPVPIGPVSKFAIKRIAQARCHVPEDEVLARCLNQIRTLLLMDLQATELGVTLCNLAGGLDESADILQVLKDCFAKKATGTILKRTSAIWSLAAWMLENEQTCVWTMTEMQMYHYMCALRDQGSPPTRASHVVEALHFFDAHLKYRKLDCKSVLSPRVLGAAHTMYLGKRKLLQAPQLSVEAVKTLEFICVSNTSLLRTVVSGALLFCIFAAARWSDFIRLENMWTDRCGDLVLVEAETSRHKTSKTKEAKTRLLPFTALGRFAEESSWGETFVEAWHTVRNITGLQFLPSWNDRSGTWSVSAMSTAEASLFLKEFLELTLGAEETMRYSSHSCKPTMLTWCGMTDILTREERTMLGHHVEPSTKSATTYNRDSQLLLQAKVSKVLAMVVKGELSPDASRASRLNQILQNDEQIGQVEASDDSDVDDGDLVSVHSQIHRVEGSHQAQLDASRPAFPIDEVDEFTFVSHKLTGTVHVVKDEQNGKLACGRRRTINMESVDSVNIDASTASFCIQCNAVMKS